MVSVWNSGFMRQIPEGPHFSSPSLEKTWYTEPCVVTVIFFTELRVQRTHLEKPQELTAEGRGHQARFFLFGRMDSLWPYRPHLTRP